MTSTRIISTNVDQGTNFSAIFATDRNTGETAWSYPFEAQNFGMSGDRLLGFWQNGNSLDHLALDVETGAELWTQSYTLSAEPYLIDESAAHLRVGFAYHPQKVRAIDPSSGELACETSIEFTGNIGQLVRMGTAHWWR